MKQLSQEEIRLSRERHVTWMARTFCVALYVLLIGVGLDSFAFGPRFETTTSVPGVTDWALIATFMVAFTALFPLAKYGRMGEAQ